MLRVRFLLSIFFAFAFFPLFSQINEDFNDGNFTNAPHIWNGTNAVWDASGQALELNATGAVPTTLASLYYLSTDFAQSSLDSTVWEFDVVFDLSLQTNNNYAEVYLTSDIANLSGANNGYFVRLMNGSSTAQGKRKISLWKSVNGSKSVLINGQDSVFSATNLGFRVRVTRNAANEWTLMHDSTLTGNNYVMEGAPIVDAQFNSSSFFGIRERHTAQSRNDWVLLDNVNVTTFAVQDLIPPTVTAVNVLSATELEVVFDEFVDVVSATTPGNYRRAGSIAPTQTQINAADSARVTLTFASLQNCISDSLEIQNVADRASNVMVTDTLPFMYCLTSTAGFRDVLISEIFPDPTPVLCNNPNAEFVELFNGGPTAVNLKDWQIQVNSSTASITTTDYFLLSGEYVILSDSLWSGPTVMMNLPTLPNTGGTVLLFNENSLLIDSVDYDQNQYASGMDQGYSLERINLKDSCGGALNWTSSMDSCQSTPGLVNSVNDTTADITAPFITSVTVTGIDSIQVCFSEPLDTISGGAAANFTISGMGAATSATLVTPDLLCVDLVLPQNILRDSLYTVSVSSVTDCNGNDTTSTGTFLVASPFQYKDVIINEIFADPTPVQCSNPNAEFIELYNRSNRVVDLNGWEITNSGSEDVITMTSYLLNPGEYIILSDSIAWASFGNFIQMDLPSLNNSEESLGLRDASFRLIDSASYVAGSWAPGDNDGFSLELVNPNDTCSTVGNWTASTDPCRQTAGAQNSVYDPVIDGTAPVVQSVVVVAEDSLLICFNETMNLASLENAANYVIDSIGGNAPFSPVFVSGIGPGYDCAYLVLGMPVRTGTMYTISTTMLADCIGNDTTQVDTFVLGAAPAPCQVVITEFMADPDENLPMPDHDFIELYNNGSVAVELSNWAFVRNGGNAGSGFPRYTLLPGEYLILCDDDTDAISAFSVFGPTLGVDFPQMNISGDNIELLDGNGNLVDRIFYTEDWYNTDEDVEKGNTYERRNVSLCCLDELNWGVSQDPRGGTPGGPSSIQDRNYFDAVPPEIVSVQVLNNQAIRLNFSEFMDAATVFALANYAVGTNSLPPSSVINPFEPDNSITYVDIVLPFMMDSAMVYCLTVSNLQDCPGNALATSDVCFGLPSQAAPGDVLINEILFDPKTGGKDYVELYNNSNKVIDLATLHLTVRDEGAIDEVDPITASQRLLFPQEYVCLTEDPDFQVQTYDPINPSAIIYADIPAYGNTDTVILYLDSVPTDFIDTLAYDDDWHFDNLDSKDGVSLERINYNGPTQDLNNWHSAASTVNYGTPGYQNSEALVPGDSMRVWLIPETFSPDEDGLDDFLYVNFNFGTPGWDVRVNVYDNKGRLVKRALQNTLLPTNMTNPLFPEQPQGVVKWDGTNDAGEKVDIGVYVILVEAQNPNANVLETATYKLGCVVAAKR